MNENLKKAIVLYATSESKLYDFLNSLSKPTLISILIDFLTIYFNDNNSSTLRELTALYIAGFEPLRGKLGYNGYKFLADKKKAKNSAR